MTESPEKSQGRAFWSLSYLSLVVCLALGVLATTYYFYVAYPFVKLPADILMFAESDFVANMIKLRNDIPLYTPPEDNNSLVYTPLSPLLTYAIASALGQVTSIPVLRAIQIGFCGVAALIAVPCCWRVYYMRWPDRRPLFPRTYSLFAFFLLFLAATAPRVNAYSYSLHADALALAATAFTFWNLLCYLDRPQRWRFFLLAACPALGFLAKQFLMIWVPITCLVLLIEQPRNIRRVLTFALLSGGLFGLTVAACYLVWGDAFMFFVFEVVGGPRGRIGWSPDAYHLSVVRSAKHFLTAWLEIAIGFFAGWALIVGTVSRKLVAVVIGWVFLIAGEALTSGNGWDILYHFGPGVLIGTIFLVAVLRGYWPDAHGLERSGARLSAIAANLVTVALVVTVMNVLRVLPAGSFDIRNWPPRRPAQDTYRYISEIEREFEGVPIESVLLDSGSWIYLKHSYLAMDRAGSVADQPPVGIYRNIERFVDRIQEGRYSRILVRNFHGPYFLYDWHDWPRPSGVREALQRHYDEVRIIPGVAERTGIPNAFTGPVSVFERRTSGH